MSIKVAVRARPLNEAEMQERNAIILRMNGPSVEVIATPETGTAHHFTYDNAFWSVNAVVAGNKNPIATQEIVFNEIGKELVAHGFEGYNGCIFAYGQTGSGKTYSMMGGAGGGKEEGIVPRVARLVFQELEFLKKKKVEACVEITYMEIYNEKVRCLLNPSDDAGFDQHPLRVREHPVTGPYVEGLTKMVVTNEKEFLQLMADGNSLRTTAATAMNAQSSRSHAIFTVTISQKKKDGALVTTKASKINLVDLAGSERASRTHATGARLQEGANINKSLSSLGLVISTLAEEFESGKAKHVPYRDSVLTWILKDNLGGNSKTVMLATVSPAADSFEETLSTLRYAERTKKIVNKAVINESNNSEVIAALQREIEQLRAQLRGSHGVEKEALEDKMHQSEEIKRELDMTLEEKLAESHRVMQEREAKMTELLRHKESEINELNSQLDDKERTIRSLQEEITRKLASAGKETQLLDEIDRLRGQIAKLEVEHAQSARARQAAARKAAGGGAGGGGGASKKSATDITLREEDLGNVRAKLAGEKNVTVRALAKAFDSLGKEVASPIVVKRTQFTTRAGEMHLADEDDSLLQLGDDGAGQQDSLLEYLDDELNLDDVEGAEDEELQLDDDAPPPPAGDDEVDLELDDDLQLDEDEGAGGAGGAAKGGEDGAADLELDLELDDELQLDDDEAAAVQQAVPTDISELQVDGAEDEELQLDDDEAAIAAALAADSANDQQPKQLPPARQRALTVTASKAAEEEQKQQQQQAAAAAAGGGPQIHEPAQTVSTIVIPSHALPNNRYLREPFRVIKVDEGALIGSKKDRIWDIDIFAKKFANLDLTGYVSFTQPAQNLFRVEKHPHDSKKVTLYFFDAPHPYELVCSSTERRQRFFELAMLLRRSSILWCPSLCIDGETDAVVQVVGTTIQRPNGKTVKVKGDAKFMVARMPYEVIDFWFGVFNMQQRPLPKNPAVIASFLPKGGHEVFIIGLCDIPPALVGNRDIAEYFLAYLGRSAFYVLANTAIASKESPKTGNNAIVIIVRRSFIVRMSHVEALELPPVKKEFTAKGDFSAVGAAVKINEASLGIIVINGNPTLADPQLRSSNIRAIMSNFPLGNNKIDIGVRFDYLLVAGPFGYHGGFTEADELAKQMKVGNVITDFSEAPPTPALAAEMNPLRIFYYVRPRTCRMDIKEYQTSRALNLPNSFVSGDLFCQRSFLSTFGEQVPRNQFIFSELRIVGNRIPHINGAELHCSAEWLDNSPVVVPLVKQGESYVANLKLMPPLKSVVPNFDFLRLQSLDFTVYGILPVSKDKKKMIIASGTFPLKNNFSLGESVPFSSILYYRACNVGTISGNVLHTAIEGEGVIGASVQERNAVAVVCHENQVLDGSGAWVPALFPDNGAWDWSTVKDAGVQARRESFQLPGEEKWKWLSEWRHEAREDSREGWHYALSFNDGFVMKAAKEHKVRRRQWSRLMQADDALTLHEFVSGKK